MLKLLLFVLPLGFDTFAVSSSLGVSGLPRAARLRVSLVLSSFEMVMPVVGLLLGHGLGTVVGGVADYAAVAALLGLGAYMLLSDEGAEEEKVALLARSRGWALLVLGLGISLDELAMGFTIGLLHLSLALAVLLTGIQAFLLAQAGLRLGARLGAAAREGAEKLAAVALLALGGFILVEKLVAG